MLASPACHPHRGHPDLSAMQSRSWHRQGMVRSETGSTTTMTARTTLPLALLGSTALALIMPMSVQAGGFVDDAKVSLNLRNYYFNRNYLNHTDPSINGERQGQADG